MKKIKISYRVKNILYLIYLLFFTTIGVLATVLLNWLFVIAVLGYLPAIIITINDIRKGGE